MGVVIGPERMITRSQVHATPFEVCCPRLAERATQLRACHSNRRIVFQAAVGVHCGDWHRNEQGSEINSEPCDTFRRSLANDSIR